MASLNLSTVKSGDSHCVPAHACNPRGRRGVYRAACARESALYWRGKSLPPRIVEVLDTLAPLRRDMPRRYNIVQSRWECPVHAPRSRTQTHVDGGRIPPAPRRSAGCLGHPFTAVPHGWRRHGSRRRNELTVILRGCGSRPSSTTGDDDSSPVRPRRGPRPPGAPPGRPWPAPASSSPPR